MAPFTEEQKYRFVRDGFFHENKCRSERSAWRRLFHAGSEWPWAGVGVPQAARAGASEREAPDTAMGRFHETPESCLPGGRRRLAADDRLRSTATPRSGRVLHVANAVPPTLLERAPRHQPLHRSGMDRDDLTRFSNESLCAELVSDPRL